MFLSIEFISDSCLTNPKILHYLLTGPECFETPPGTNGKNSSVVWKSCQEKRVSMRKFQCATILLGIEALVVTIINFNFLPECLSSSLASPPCFLHNFVFTLAQHLLCIQTYSVTQNIP